MADVVAEMRLLSLKQHIIHALVGSVNTWAPVVGLARDASGSATRQATTAPHPCDIACVLGRLRSSMRL